MSLFSRHRAKALPDLSVELRDADDWSISTVKERLNLLGEVTALACEPVLGLLATGDSSGSIRIFGGPSVDVEITPSGGIPIKFLQFAAPTLARLVSVDGRDNLCIWNLDGHPECVAKKQYQDMITCLACPAAHSHAFLGFKNGSVHTYDLSRLCPSPYKIHDAWAAYEEKLQASGLHDRPKRSVPTMVMDILPHPRNLSLILIAYEGGVILWDISRKAVGSVYELEYPRNLNQATNWAITPTTLAFHPSGEMFAVGHANGVVAFWAVDDEDKPLDTKDPSGCSIHFALWNPPPSTEPIYKVSWSGDSEAADGKTHFTMLGCEGVVTLHFPPLSYTPVTSPSGLHADVRQAFRLSLYAIQTSSYPTATPHDFVLIPRSNPHFMNSFDPLAIIVTAARANGGKTVNAFRFPPLATVLEPKLDVVLDAQIDQATISEHADASHDHSVASTTGVSEAKSGTPAALMHQLDLPQALSSAIISSAIVTMPKQSFARIDALRQAGQDDLGGKRLPLWGGVATPNLSSKGAPDPRTIKYAPHEILVTGNEDLTIRFYDTSPQLLVSPTPLSSDHPHFYSHLTIDLRELLQSDLIWASISTPIEDIKIQGFQFAEHSLECAIALESGELLLFKFSEAQPQAELTEPTPHDRDIVNLSELATWEQDGFKPVLLLSPKLGKLACFGQSDIGFFAASFDEGSLLIVDVRGPKIIYRGKLDGSAPVKSLKWTVAGSAEDHRMAPTLVAVQQSGAISLLPVTRTSGSWVVDELKISQSQPHSSLENTLESFVLEAKSGADWSATPERLQLAMLAESEALPDKDSNVTHLLVVASATEARCLANLSGQKLSRVHWPKDEGEVRAACVVEHADSCALAVFFSSRKVLIYSVPELQLMHSWTIPTLMHCSQTLGSIRCNRAGCFSETCFEPGSEPKTSIWSLFKTRQPLSPLVDLCPHPVETPLPPRKYRAGSSVMGWLMSAVDISLSGDTLDGILAGPNRPALKEKPETHSPSPSGAATSANWSTGDVFSHMTAAAAERGERLGQLEEHFGELETHSRNMLDQAKRVAARESARASAKNWFGF